MKWGYGMTAGEEYRDVLVFGEVDGEELSVWTAQLLSIGKRIARGLGQELSLLMLGSDGHKAGHAGFGHGADKVYIATDPLLENYMTDSYLQVMEQLAKELKPNVVLFGQNEKGMDLAPRLAFRLGTGVTLDCVDLEVDSKSGSLKQIKPVFGGKAHCQYVCSEKRPQIITIRDRTFEPSPYDASKTGEPMTLSLSLNLTKIRTRLIEKRRDDGQTLARKLMSAPVVISGGRGLQRKEGFELLKETAELLGGVIAGSRPAVDNGWLPNTLQVGLTGQKISPEIYLAVGISGAIQHMAGCLKSKVIIAINNNREAPIFRFSHYGIVGDYGDVLKAFNHEIRRLVIPK
jgi:electron transfer flavoprotein alpha subunit